MRRQHPIPQMQNPAGRLRDRQVMGDLDNGVSLPVQFLKQTQNFPAGGGIQRAGRLIRQQQRRSAHKSAGNGHTLLLAALKLAGPVLQPVFQPHAGQAFPGDRFRLPVGEAPQQQRHHHILQHIVLRQQVIALEYKADFCGLRSMASCPGSRRKTSVLSS